MASRVVRPAATHRDVQSDTHQLLVESYGLHRRRIGRQVFAVLGPDADAEDVVQDTWVSALGALPTLRNQEALSAWLAGIAMRLACREIRRRKVRGRLLRKLVEVEAIDQERSVVRPREERIDLARFLAGLAAASTPPKWAWMLRRVEERSLAEVATAMECSTATAKRWIKSVDLLAARRAEEALR